MRAFFCLFLAFATLGIVASDTPKSTRWISKTFIGGSRCAAQGSEAAFVPPGFAPEVQRLQKLGITVLRAYFRDHAVCEACHCPRYRRELLFEIPAVDVPRHNDAGYNVVTPPESAELLEYERSKVYRPPSDTPEQ